MLMETLILVCLKAQLIAQGITKSNLQEHVRYELIAELKKVSPQDCKIS